MVRNDTRDWFLSFSRHLGYIEILKVELSAIFQGLSFAIILGFARIKVLSDSMMALELVRKPVPNMLLSSRP